ncbi:MAG: nicotinate (nicotinamide) nucleotide adenylyltransferase [Nitrospirae bacterium]|nr:nicotinate (nicotinamide) nucleotide adenylyltransferase [Nitrospirota bacterium]
MPLPRTAVFGGAFNPVHRGHVALARYLTRKLELERLVFVPVGKPAHRILPDDPGCSERLILLEKAIAGEPRWEISDFECRSDKVSYTVRTVEALFPEERPWLILGSDAFMGLDGWFEPGRLLARVHLLVAWRPGDTLLSITSGVDRLASFGLAPVLLPEMEQPGLPEVFVQRFRHGEVETYFGFVRPGTPDLSSSRTRDALRRGEPLEEFLPANVKSYIVEKGLYGFSSTSTIRTRSGP